MKIRVVYDKNGKLIAAELDTPVVSHAPIGKSHSPTWKFLPTEDQHVAEFEAPEEITNLTPENFLRLSEMVEIDTTSKSHKLVFKNKR